MFRAQNRQPEVQVLVVFTQHDLGCVGAVNPKDANPLHRTTRTRCRQVARCLQPGASDQTVAKLHQRGDPRRLIQQDAPCQLLGAEIHLWGQQHGIRIGKVRRRISLRNGRMGRNGNGANAGEVGSHSDGLFALCLRWMVR